MTPIAIFIFLVFIFTLISKRIEKTIITAPMIFTLAGIGVYLILPRLSYREVHNETVLLVAELTLAILLFTDATHIDLRKLLKETTFPLRLLGIGMPLTILAGAVVAVLLFREFSIWEAALLAVILAPTDAGLGQVIVKSRIVPDRIRQALGVEAGLNDGLTMPFFSLFLGLSIAVESFGPVNWLIFTAEQIGFGLLIGIAIGWIGGWLLGAAGKRDWVDESLQQLGLLAIAMVCYGTAGFIGGNGFIAAFVGGLVVKRGFEDARYHMADFSEVWGQLLNFFVFFIFGLIVAPLFPTFNGIIAIYAALSLTIVRMLPVAIAMIGTRLKTASVLFLGWFGPRGLASIVLGLIFLEREAHLTVETTITLAVAATVLLSIFAHGISALPGMKWYAKQIEELDERAPELQETVSVLSGLQKNA
jgi:NhaP-type Na+/H+ or K+/H+ antiporter